MLLLFIIIKKNSVKHVLLIEKFIKMIQHKFFVIILIVFFT